MLRASTARQCGAVGWPGATHATRVLLHADAEEIDDNVDAGNKELQQAVSRDSSNFRNLVVGLLLGASVCLLFLDYYA